MEHEHEKLILGAWICGEHLDDMKLLKPTDFQVYSNVVDYMQRHGVTGDGVDYEGISKACNIPLAELSNCIASYHDLMYQRCMKELLGQKLQRKVRSVNSSGDIDKLFEDYELYKNYGFQKELPKPYEGFMYNLVKEFDARQRQELVPTGLPKLDAMMCGIKRKELTTIGARPSVGKSAFSLQIALNIAWKGYRTLYFPLEMSAVATMERIAYKLTDVPVEHMKRGTLSRDDYRKLSEDLSPMDALEEKRNFLMYEGENELETITELIKRDKPYLVVIDQLEQLRARKDFKDKRERFSHMTSELKRLSMAENVAVILCCQVGRSSQGKEPTMDNLKESGSIEEDSDNVILLHRLEAEEMFNPDDWQTKKPVLVNLAKQRSGETGKLVTAFIPNKLKFYEVEGETR